MSTRSAAIFFLAAMISVAVAASWAAGIGWGGGAAVVGIVAIAVGFSAVAAARFRDA